MVYQHGNWCISIHFNAQCSFKSVVMVARLAFWTQLTLSFLLSGVALLSKRNIEAYCLPLCQRRLIVLTSFSDLWRARSIDFKAMEAGKTFIIEEAMTKRLFSIHRSFVRQSVISVSDRRLYPNGKMCRSISTIVWTFCDRQHRRYDLRYYQLQSSNPSAEVRYWLA